MLQEHFVNSKVAYRVPCPGRGWPIFGFGILVCPFKPVLKRYTDFRWLRFSSEGWVTSVASQCPRLVWKRPSSRWDCLLNILLTHFYCRHLIYGNTSRRASLCLHLSWRSRFSELTGIDRLCACKLLVCWRFLSSLLVNCLVTITSSSTLVFLHQSCLWHQFDTELFAFPVFMNHLCPCLLLWIPQL